MDELKERWGKKRIAIYSLKENIDKLKRKIRIDLSNENEKEKLTAAIIKIMVNTSERVGNQESAENGHFGVTQFRKKHIEVIGNTIHLKYVGKSGVEQDKTFSDEKTANILNGLKKRKHTYLFTTEDGFKIQNDRVNRYLSQFDITSKDIRGYNANRYVVAELKKLGIIKEEKMRPRTFNMVIRKVAEKIGHKPATLRGQYLLPEIEDNFYATGKVKKINI
jgi:DNA topoisomerase IB